MSLEVSVYSTDPERETQWVNQIQVILERWLDVKVMAGGQSETLGTVIFIDGTCNANSTEEVVATSRALVNSIASKYDLNGRVLYLMVDESTDQFPDLLLERKVDDIILLPFRPLELLSRVQNFEQMLLWTQVNQVSISLTEILSHLQKDLEFTQRLQKAKLPKRFDGITGFKIVQRYLAGMRSGGDYFDLAETKDQKRLILVLTNSSSYGLSNSILSVLMRLTVKLSMEQLNRVGAVSELVHSIYQEILLTLGEKDQLSFFFGALSREDLVLRFTHFGDTCLYYAPPGEAFQFYSSQSGIVSKNSEWRVQEELQIQLHPHGKLALLSHGFTDLVGGQKKAHQILNQYRNQDSEDALNELVYLVKSQLDEEDMPARDCSAILMEVQADASTKVIQFVKPKQDEIET